VQLRDGARRMLVTLGSGLALLGFAVAGNVSSALAATPPPAPTMAPPHRLLEADLFVVAPTTLRSSIATAVRRLHGVVAAEPLDAARLQVGGKLTAMLGVDPSEFRAFAPKPTADSARLWENVATGGVAVSYTMSKLDKLPLGKAVKVSGRRAEELPVAGLGTVGIGGVDAVVSDAVARSLGIPANNAIVISAPHADLSTLIKQIKKLLPRSAAVAPLVAQLAAEVVALRHPSHHQGLHRFFQGATWLWAGIFAASTIGLAVLMATETVKVFLLLTTAVTIGGTVAGTFLSALWFFRVLRRFGLRVRFAAS